MSDVPYLAAARRDMKAQCWHNDGYGYSLDSLWRACGCPAGKDPATWLVLARPVLEALEDYHAAWTGGEMGAFLSIEVSTWERKPGEPPDPYWEHGDSMASHVVADLYAGYLDFAADVADFHLPQPGPTPGD
jgi:hypothetical protein